MNSVVVHYQEIALKGRNRPWFIERLVRNIRAATEDLDVRRVRRHGPHRAGAWAWCGLEHVVRERLRRPVRHRELLEGRRAPSDLHALGAAILPIWAIVEPESFMVAARRSDKRYPIPSPAIEQELGARIKVARGWNVNLARPAFTVHVEVLRDRAFYYFDKQHGAGGLPTGVSGRVACLMSGGIDSPVAAWRMMRRGCRAQLIHFHGYPYRVDGVAGEGARAGGGADALPAPQPALSRAVRRGAAAGA